MDQGPTGASDALPDRLADVVIRHASHSKKAIPVQRRAPRTTTLVLSTLLSLGSGTVAANAQTAKTLPSDVIAANQELDRQLLEAHRLLDVDKVMVLFANSPDIFFISPGSAELLSGPDQIRKSWTQFFASLQSIHGEIDHITYLPAGNGVIGVGQVTYHRQLKGRAPDQRIVVWTDFRRQENGKWVYLFRHAHLVGNPLADPRPSEKSPTSERP